MTKKMYQWSSKLNSLVQQGGNVISYNLYETFEHALITFFLDTLYMYIFYREYLLYNFNLKQNEGITTFLMENI